MESPGHQGQHGHRAALKLQSNPAVDDPHIIHQKFLWGCCLCDLESGGMSSFIDQCPIFECGHFRCGDCPVDSVKIRGEGSQFLSEISSGSFVDNSCLAPVDRILSSASPLHKHGCETAESDDEEEDSRSKRQRRDAEDDPDCDPSMGTALETPSFACHFHKRDWKKYISWKGQRYDKCIGSRIQVTRLQRIKSVPCSFQSAPRLILC